MYNDTGLFIKGGFPSMGQQKHRVQKIQHCPF